METVDFIGYAATLMGLFTFFPQVIKTWKTKRTKDIALGMYAIFWLGVVCWLSYGLLIKNLPIVVNNVIMFVLISTMLIFKIKFDEKTTTKTLQGR